MTLEFKIDIFDPRKESLEKIVDLVRDITADPKKITKDELALVSDTRKMLGKHRIKIAKAGLSARNEANAYAGKVIAYEKELIAIIEPEEKRLKGIEDSMKEHNIREVRREKLPEIRERLQSVELDITITDEELLDFDPNQLDAWFNNLVALKNEQDRIALESKQELGAAKREAERKVIEEERQKLEHDKDIEKAKKETEARVKKEAKEEEVRVTKEKKEDEMAHLENDKFQKFLIKNGCSKQDMGGFHLVYTDSEAILYKEIARYKKEL